METNEEIKKDIEKPSRYTVNGVDLIDLFPQMGFDFSQAAIFNIMKYLMRAGKKEGNTALKDYMKAAVYLKRLIEYERKKEQIIEEQQS